MNKITPIALLATVATLAVVPAAVLAAEANQQVREGAATAVAGPAVSVGRSLYTTEGKRIAQIYRVTANGDVQVIVNSKLFTVAAASLSDVNGKLTTSQTLRR